MRTVLKLLVFIVGICGAASGWAQNRFEVDKGEIDFTSNAKLELIKASSQKIQGIIDPATQQFAFIVKIQSFEGFNSGLQREHFNERYMETDKFYHATFSGKIVEAIDFSKDGVYEVHANGNLIIHGKKQPRVVPGKIKIEKGVLTVDADFNVPLVDHDIKVPEVVGAKIASEILVKINLVMSLKEKK